MKKFGIFLVLILSMFCFCSCQTQTSAEADSFDNLICYMIEQNTNYENLSDETIKALAVIYRSNLNSSNDLDIQSYYPQSERVSNLTNSTSGETLKTFDLSENEIEVICNDSETWTKSIPKSKILKMLSKKNISLSNISQVEPTYNNGELEALSIGGKEISFNEIANEFEIPSNKITSIQNTLSSIELSGTYDTKNTFSLSKAENCSKLGENYVSILKNCINYE